MSISLQAIKPAVTDAVDRAINNPKRASRLAKYAVVVAARLVMFSVLSPIGAAAHQDYVGTITAMATSMSDEGYAEAVRMTGTNTIATQRGSCVAPKAA